MVIKFCAIDKPEDCFTDLLKLFCPLKKDEI